MLDIKFIRENPGAIKKDLKKREDKEKIAWVDELVKKDAEWKKLKQESDKLRHKRNSITLEINRLKKEGKDVSKKLKEARELPAKINTVEEEMNGLQQRIDFIRMRLPNILHESVPVGKDSSENVEVKRWGKPKRFSFELRSHGELAEALKVADFKRAAKISGTGFVYVKGALAMLDLALQRFAVDFLTRKGYLLIEPPLMMSRQAYEGVTDLADFENVMYKIEGENNYLIATSEHPMGAMYMNEVIEEAELPIRLCGISSCFRKEIGSHGVDTRGFFRMHQFNKVEQFVFCLPRDSWKMHEELQKNSEELYKKLRIPFRVVNICTGDIGTVASKKYDIEAWFPRDSNYAEVGSNSNCLSYQAVRLNIRYKKKTGEGEVKDYVHTLNNTAIATSRVMRAILENYQNKDGSVTVPEVLVKYMNGIKKIK
jgi:seryl-tRNA synthetase